MKGTNSPVKELDPSGSDSLSSRGALFPTSLSRYAFTRHSIAIAPIRSLRLRIRTAGCVVLIMLLSIGAITASAQKEQRSATTKENRSEIIISAAASLADSMHVLRSNFIALHPGIQVTYNFGSSGALQQQIEHGAPVDVFFPAGIKQMAALQDKSLMDDATVRHIVKNNVVILVSKGVPHIGSFEELAGKSIASIGVGDPGSVPAGQYAVQVFRNLGIYDELESKLILAKDVREVLTWVKTGNVHVGIVYATDAQGIKNGELSVDAPEGSHDPIIYPIGVVKNSEHPEEARLFVEYLLSSQAAAVFRTFGFFPLN